MEGGDHQAGVTGWWLLAVFRDADIAVIIFVVVVVVLFFLQVLGSCPEMCAVIIIFFSKFAGHEC